MPKRVHILLKWLSKQLTKVNQHEVILFSANGTSKETLDELYQIVKCHYVDRTILAQLVETLGACKTADIFKHHLKTYKRAKLGDVGKIFASELIECQLGHHVPVRRLRCHAGGNLLTNIEDVIAVAHDSTGTLKILKGTSIYCTTLTDDKITEAMCTLNGNDGKPTRTSVLFIANQLRGMGNFNAANELETATLNGFKNCLVQHVLFVLTGTDSSEQLTSYVKVHAKERTPKFTIGVYVKDHVKLVKHIYRGTPND